MKRMAICAVTAAVMLGVTGCGGNTANNLGATDDYRDDVYGSNVYWDESYGVNTGVDLDRTSYGMPKTTNTDSFANDVKNGVENMADDVKDGVKEMGDDMKNAVDDATNTDTKNMMN